MPNITGADVLQLALDGPATGLPLREALYGGGPSAIVAAIAAATPALAERLAAGQLHGDPAALVGSNQSGDAQKALDIGAHLHMLAALAAVGVRQVLSEEAEAIAVLNPGGAFDVAIDPIDGSGSIGIGAPLGLLFSILPAAPEGFLRTGRAIVAAGYASFGHSCDFGWSLGDGVHVATFDRALGDFRLTRQGLRLSATAKTIAYNASNERFWAPGLQAWVRDLRENRDVNMRWLAAAVGELHRILLQGGAFLYPADRREGYHEGRLRLIYEAAPIAFLIEQAGGKASDGLTPILDLQPRSLHQHTPLIFGAADEVDRITRALSQPKG